MPVVLSQYQKNYSNPTFREGQAGSGILTKPIEKVQNVINNSVETFVKQEESEEKKTSTRNAIAVGSSVLVLTAFVALLNPKFSGKLVERLKKMSSKAKTKSEKNGFYKASEKVLGKVVSFLQFTNTANAGKDVLFKKFCTETKGVKTLMSKPHKVITSWFDSISKHTVLDKYKKVNKRMQSLENLVSHYKSKLPQAEQQKLEAKLQEIKTTAEYFSKSKTADRLKNQEVLMSDLESQFKARWSDYARNLKNSKNKTGVMRENMSYWAEDILMPKRNRLQQEGENVVRILMGDGKNTRGSFNELADIVEPYLSKEENALVKDSVAKISRKLTKANHSETLEYFDKKRDLMLGGAPTDILTALFGLGMSGVAIGTANNKEDKISRALTVGFPAVAGIGTSLIFTAKLFSGVQGLLYGLVASVGLSKIGSIADKYITPKRQTEVVDA